MISLILELLYIRQYQNESINLANSDGLYVETEVATTKVATTEETTTEVATTSSIDTWICILETNIHEISIFMLSIT
jgi:hypothetical protein